MGAEVKIPAQKGAGIFVLEPLIECSV
jgi:hypothetical protein